MFFHYMSLEIPELSQPNSKEKLDFEATKPFFSHYHRQGIKCEQGKEKEEEGITLMAEEGGGCRKAYNYSTTSLQGNSCNNST